MKTANNNIKNRNNTIHLLKSILWNRSDDNDMDWEEIDEIKKEIDKISNPKSIDIITGDNLLLDCETDYFFVGVNNKDNVNDLCQELKTTFDKYYSSGEHIENLISSKNIAIIFILNDLETRAYVDNTFIQIEQELLSHIKSLINKKPRIKMEHLFILNQKDIQTVEICDVDRYSIIQEPKLINKINFDLEEQDEKKEHQAGYVATVKLKELINLYNTIGDKLFENNVRYGISEQMGVDEAIKKTLKNHGEKFWYRNNGVTILVKSNEFKLFNPNKIIFNKNDNFSVINGAQTITVASNYYYETLAKIQNSKDEPSKTENTDVKDSEEKIIKENIEKAKVLLRIICINDKDSSETDKEGTEISVALNRQKPIKAVDLAYTLDFVYDIKKILEEINNENSKFDLIKRGENDYSSGSMDLVEFARARLACLGEPLKARNESANSFFILDGDKQILKFKRDDIFKDCTSVDEFKKYYNGIKFAHDLSVLYISLKKDVLKKNSKGLSPDEKRFNTLVNNAKWIFISHVMEALNDGTEDYSKFDYSVKEYNISAIMTSYYDQALVITNSEISIATFKSKTWADNIKNTIDIKEILEQNKIDKNLHTQTESEK